MLKQLHQLLYLRLWPITLQSAEALYSKLCITLVGLSIPHFSKISATQKVDYIPIVFTVVDTVTKQWTLSCETITSCTTKQERKGKRKDLNQHTVHSFILLCHLAYGHSCDQDSNWHFSQLTHLFSFLFVLCCSTSISARFQVAIPLENEWSLLSVWKKSTTYQCIETNYGAILMK